MEKKKSGWTIVLFFLYLQAIGQSGQTKEDTLFWYTDMKKAQEISTASGKPLFAFFTGSDWCPWCRKLQKDVFAKPAFIEWAKKNVVLVELDFPRNKRLSTELAQQNRSLQQAFQVQGYPTVQLFYLHKNADGINYTIDSIGALGYPRDTESGKEELKFLKEADALLGKRSLK